MTNLDKLLKRIEKNKEQGTVQKTFPLTIAGETFEVLTMTRAEKREFLYAQETGQKSKSVGEIVKMLKRFIYNSMQLAPLATKAKEEGLINSYYDVVEALFEPEEIIEIISFIFDINNLGEFNPEKEIEEEKK